MRIRANIPSSNSGFVRPAVVLILGVAMLVFFIRHFRVRLIQSDVRQVAPHDVGSQMNSYTKQGRYDEAVQIGLQSLRNDPSDKVIYEGIATVYLVRAEKEPDEREQWVRKAVSFAEKALSLNTKDSDAAGVHLFQDARTFELAGDLSADKRCMHYDKARKLLEARASQLQGDQVTLAGKTFPLEPLRKENDKVLTGVKDKATKAGCK